MKIDLHPNFKRAYKNRIANNPKLVERMKKRIDLFQCDPTNPLLRDHSLKGIKYQYRSFSITGDIRIIYKKVNKTILFYDIGSHNQVY